MEEDGEEERSRRGEAGGALVEVTAKFEQVVKQMREVIWALPPQMWQQAQQGKPSGSPRGAEEACGADLHKEPEANQVNQGATFGQLPWQQKTCEPDSQEVAVCTPPRTSTQDAPGIATASSPAVLSLASALPSSVSPGFKMLNLAEWIPDQASTGKSTQTPSLPTRSKRMSLSSGADEHTFQVEIVKEMGFTTLGIEVNQEHGALRVEHIDEHGLVGKFNSQGSTKKIVEGDCIVEAWHLGTSTFTLPGRCDTYGTGLGLVTRLGSAWSPVTPWRFCVAGVALGDIDLHFVWQQAWHLDTSTFTLRGRRGTYGTGLGLVTRLGPAWSPVTLRRFAGQAWRLVTSALTHRLSLCEAGVARMALGWVWQAWHLWHWAGSGDALGSGLVTCDAAAFCVAGVALGDIDLHFVWQAWRLETSTFTLCGRCGADGTGLGLVTRLGPAWSPVTPRCVRGVALESPVMLRRFCVAGVALDDIGLPFVWHAWHLDTSTFTLRGRRGTYGAGLGLVTRLGPAWSPVTLRRCAWQAWHLVTSASPLCGRRGTWTHRLSLCEAGGVALMSLGWVW
eukprot:s342_g9.t1